MPAALPAEQTLIATAQVLYEQKKTCRDVAKTLGVSVATAWKYKHAALLDTDLVQHVSKTLADKSLLCANAAVDTFLDKAENGDLAKESPIALAKAASVLMQSAGAYAALSGAKDTWQSVAGEYGIENSHSASRVTIEQKITVEGGQKRAKVINPTTSLEDNQ